MANVPMAVMKVENFRTKFRPRTSDKVERRKKTDALSAKMRETKKTLLEELSQTMLYSRTQLSKGYVTVHWLNT